ncbi:hypothetical protein DPMN_170376 [Dreissena polymorpha]|uniref:Uncharacterized protein n=1 Tax=Dreissena polymorpha TaxID=45954 RepID=A0A9D4IEI7_DREPO|nr:hypothetical protein DPMN_170376 [Dreissena polymorpha]
MLLNVLSYLSGPEFFRSLFSWSFLLPFSILQDLLRVDKPLLPSTQCDTSDGF